MTISPEEHTELRKGHRDCSPRKGVNMTHPNWHCTEHWIAGAMFGSGMTMILRFIMRHLEVGWQ